MMFHYYKSRLYPDATHRKSFFDLYILNQKITTLQEQNSAVVGCVWLNVMGLYSDNTGLQSSLLNHLTVAIHFILIVF